ncbi:MAG: resolvase [Cyanobacteria bacterium RYN_339]|nr:resolvase [Cyanobacteria bacterium RYN_339]
MGRRRSTAPAETDSANKPREAVFYVRVSSKEQEEGFSIDAQILAARGYALEHGLQVVQEFADVESAKRAGRRQFEEMVKFLKKHQQCMVVVEKTDRLYRNLKDWVTLDTLMQENDLQIHLYKENTVLTRDARSHEKFMHGIKVLMAKNYSDNLSEEIRKGLNEKARQGHYPLRAPTGYKTNPDSRVLEIDPAKGPLVRRLFEKYATGGFSLSDLVTVAKQDGLTVWDSSKTMTRAGLHRMLTSPYYTGVFVWKGKQVPGKHTPLISRELFDKVQAIMGGRNGGDFQDRSFAFTGLLTCGHCGCQITAELRKEKYTYYHCTGGRGPCPGKRKNVREEVISAQLSHAVAALQLDERFAETLRVALKESLVDEQEYHERALAALQAQETKLVDRRRRLYEDRYDDKVPADVCDELAAKWDKELIEIREKMAAHKEADRKFLEHGLRLFELAQTAYSQYIRRSPSEKRQMLNFLLSNCQMTDGVVVPTYRQPFDLIAAAPRMTQENGSLDPSDPGSRLIKWR